MQAQQDADEGNLSFERQLVSVTLSVIAPQMPGRHVIYGNVLCAEVDLLSRYMQTAAEWHVPAALPGLWHRLSGRQSVRRP